MGTWVMDVFLVGGLVASLLLGVEYDRRCARALRDGER